ncbi:MAG: prepilin-type N-terminal cleavage/methylation domain-containing protein [Myxococcota bacterium]
MTSGTARGASECARRGNQGFTLVEIVTVVLILGVAAWVALPAAAPTAPFALERATESFARAIRFARDESLRTDAPFGVEVDTVQRRLRVFRGDAATNPPTPIFDVVDPLSGRLYDVALEADASMRDIGIVATPTWTASCTAPLRLGFEGRGAPRCGDPWSVLLQTATIDLTLAGHTRRIAIDGVTGRVSLP